MQSRSGTAALTRIGLATLAALAALALPGAAGAAELVQVSPSVWWSKGSEPGLVVNGVIVTPDGLIVVDGSCEGDATSVWLKDELKRRFNLPVRYTVMSHNHESHACGLEVFADTALTIAQTNARAHVLREKRHTAVPQITFDKELVLWLGGKEVRLLHYGLPTHGNDLVQVYVPDEKILIAPDFMQRGKGIPTDYRDVDVDNMLEMWNYYYRMYDIDWIVNGHSAPSPKDDILNNIQFTSALRARVLDEIMKGTPLDEMVKTMELPEFSTWRNYDTWLDGAIVSMWDYLYRQREPNDGPANDAWQDVKGKVLNGAHVATDVKD